MKGKQMEKLTEDLKYSLQRRLCVFSGIIHQLF